MRDDRYRHRGAGSGRHEAGLERETSDQRDHQGLHVPHHRGFQFGVALSSRSAPNSDAACVGAGAADFAHALSRDATVNRFFEGVYFANKQRIVVSFEATKTSGTRGRRTARGVTSLREHRSERGTPA